MKPCRMFWFMVSMNMVMNTFMIMFIIMYLIK